MKNKKIESCYLCEGNNFKKRPGQIRDLKDIEILECNECELVFLSSFDHIKNDHYQNSGMHNNTKPDIENWIKESKTDDLRRFNFLNDRFNGSILDFGCGAGGFVDLLSSSGADIAGIEPEKALQSHFEKNGLNVFESIDAAQKTGRKWDLITAFHVFEHLSDPISVMKQLSEILSPKGELIIEVPNANDALLELYNNSNFQRFTYWSQHLFYFNNNTLRDLINQAGFEINFVKNIQRFPLSNHLFWLAKGKPGGHVNWNFFNDENLDYLYEQKLASLKMTDTIIASVRK